MKTLLFSLTTALLFFAQNDALACSCFGSDGFLDTIENTIVRDIQMGREPSSPTVVIGTVVSHLNNSMILDIEGLLSGTESRKKVTVWGDNGMLCRPYVTTFPVGTRWIMNLNPVKQESRGNEKPDDYVINICGTYWLSVEVGASGNGVMNAIGRISDMSKQTMTTSDLKKAILQSIENGTKEGETKIARIKSFGVTCSLTEFQGLKIHEQNHLIQSDGQWGFTQNTKSIRPTEFGSSMVLEISSTVFRSGQGLTSKGKEDLEVVPDDIQALQKDKFQAQAIIRQSVGEKSKRSLFYSVKLWQGSNSEELALGKNPSFGTSTYGSITLDEIASADSRPLTFSKTVGLFVEFLGKPREVKVDLICQQINGK